MSEQLEPSLQPGTEGFYVTDDYALVHRLTLDPPGPVLPVANADLVGFVQDLYSEYRMPSVRLRGPREPTDSPHQGPASVTVPVDKVGAYYVAFVVYDGPGREIFDVWVNDTVHAGTITAVRDNNRQHLYVSSKPFEFTARCRLKLVARTDDGQHRLEDVLLLKALPNMPRQLPQVRGLRTVPARLIPSGQEAGNPAPGSTVVAWRTDDMARCAIELGDSPELLEPVAQEKRAANNHRDVLPDLTPGNTYSLRISGTTRHGDPIQSEVVSFVAGEVGGRAAGPRDRSDSPHTGPSTTAGYDVPVTLARETDTRAGASWPLTFGVPFPMSERWNLNGLTLTNESAKAVSSQLRVAGRWTDGSVKWVHVDAQVAPDDTRWNLATRSGASVEGAAANEPDHSSQLEENAPSVTVTETDDTVSIDTGAIRFEVPRHNTSLLNNVSVFAGGRSQSSPFAGAELDVVDAADTRFLAAAPDLVVVEERGPMRATILVTGGYADSKGNRFGRYQCRIHAYAGLPWTKLSWTFENDVTETDFISVRSMRMRLRGDFGASAAGTLGGKSSPVQAKAGDGGNIELLQWLDDRYMVRTDSAANHDAPTILRRDGSRAPGWATIQGESGSLGVCLAEFWQRYPKALSVGAEGVNIGLCPPLPEEPYDEFDGTAAEHRLFYFHRDGCYRLRQGVSFSQEMIISFAPSGTATEIESLAAQLASPPVAVVPPERFVATDVFGELGCVGGEIGEAYNQATESCYSAFLADRDAHRSYGFLNYGDWWGERQVNWGNCEYDTPYAFLLQFVRKGDPRFLKLGRAAQMHHGDVDTIRYHARPDRIGRVCGHSIGHTGGYYTERRPEWGPGSPETHFSVDHTWVDGHLATYFLTGDRRALETADLIGRRYAGPGTDDFDFTNCRIPGWHMILTTAMYEATNDPFYLNACEIIAERILERQTADGGWRRELIPGHCHDLPRHQGNAGFMVGVILSSLRRYYQLTESDNAAVREAIVRGADFMVDDMWVPEEGAFRYTSCPNSPVLPDLNFLMLDGIAFAQRLTGDSRLAGVLQGGSERHIGDAVEYMRGENIRGQQGVGKIISMAMCFTPPIIGALSKLLQSEVA